MSRLSPRILTAMKRHLFSAQCERVAVLWPRRILTITFTGCHCIPRVEVQPNKARRLDCASWSWRRPRTSWFVPQLIITFPISPLHFLAVQYAVHAFGLRVVAVGLSSFLLMPPQRVSHCISPSDTGAEKKELCLSLGAEKWVDFRETKDLVKDIKNAAGGEGPHAALVSAASVSFFCKITSAL